MLGGDFMNKRTKYSRKRNLVLFGVVLIVMISALYVVLFPKTRVMAEKNINISVNNIPAKQVECVGKIKLEKDVNYIIDISTESNDKIFVALSNSDNIINAQGVEWKQYYEITGKELRHTFTDIEIGDFYVYVGSKGNEIKKLVGTIVLNTNPSSNLNATDLKNIDDTNDIDISVSNIQAKEVACVGKIKLEKNVNYIITISAETKDKIFVALSDSDDIVNAQGVEWKQYYEITSTELQHTFTDIEIGNFYVYVGSKGGPLENVQGKLSIIR